MNSIKLLDCTLRDGAYIVDSNFGDAAIRGIIRRLKEANIDIIECGWLKDAPHKEGSSFFHVPDDLKQYIGDKGKNSVHVVMIDWNRYDLNNLPDNNGETIDAIRVVFPKEHFVEGIALGKIIKEKGYDVYFQAANTLGYSDDELIRLAEEVNKSCAVSLSVVDTFGAMDYEDLDRIVSVLDAHLRQDITLGFHSHNNQQMSYALCQVFVKEMAEKRNVIVDSSLCGMGRGAGNATTELMANFLNKKHFGKYDMNIILDTIDTFMTYYQEKYTWGYSTPYFLSGIHCAHVNNIAYLLNNHRSSARAITNVFGSMSSSERQKYDYDLLEEKYLEYCSRNVDDNISIDELRNRFKDRKVLLLSPGKTLDTEYENIQKLIEKERPIIIGINAAYPSYQCDYLFFTKTIRYEYAKDEKYESFSKSKHIMLSNVECDNEDYIINYDSIIKRGWAHYDNAAILCLRLLFRLYVKEVSLAGFDGFSERHEDNYADSKLQRIDPGMSFEELNKEIIDMLNDFKSISKDSMNIEFVTRSKYEGI